MHFAPKSRRPWGSGTVVRGTVEYRSGPGREDMPRKSLDIRFTDNPLAKGKGQLRLSLLKEAPIDPQRLIRMAKESRGSIRLTAGESPLLLCRLRPGETNRADALLAKADELVQQLLTAEAGGKL